MRSAEYLKSLGIPGHSLFYDTASYDTRSNWREARKIIDKNKFKKIALISSPIHLFRISRVAGETNYQICYDSYNFSINDINDFFNVYYKLNKEMFVFTLYYLLPDKLYDKWIKSYRDRTYSQKNN